MVVLILLAKKLRDLSLPGWGRVVRPMRCELLRILTYLAVSYAWMRNGIGLFRKNREPIIMVMLLTLI